MSENFRSEQSVELSLKTRWWLQLIVTMIMPTCLIIAYITSPNFLIFEGIMLIITIFAIFEVVLMVISILRRKVIKRFSVVSSTRILVFEVFWSGIRVLKRIYPFETINKFDLILRNMKKSRGMYSSIQQVEILTLVLQSGKMKYFTGILNQDNAKTWAMQLNNLLQDQGGFPAERFTEPLTPHWRKGNKKTQKILFIIIKSGYGVIFLLLLYVIFVLGPK